MDGFLAFVSRLNSLIQRLQHARINGGNHVHRRVQFFFRHSRFPCVRKAPIHSWIAQAHHCHSQADKHFFTVGEAFNGVGFAIEGTKICFL